MSLGLSVHRHDGARCELRCGLDGDEQGRRDSNPQPPVLETGALPIELLPSGPVRADDRIAAAFRPRRARLDGRESRAQPARLSARLRERAMSTAAAAPAGGRGRRDARPAYARRRPDSSERPRAALGRVVERGEDRRRAARASARAPRCAASCSVRSSRRYWTSSAWQRRHVSTWRSAVEVDRRSPSTSAGQQRGRPRHTAWTLSAPSVVAGHVRAACGGPGAAAPWPPTR